MQHGHMNVLLQCSTVTWTYCYDAARSHERKKNWLTQGQRMNDILYLFIHSVDKMQNPAISDVW
jgi:hypothetical protein